MSQLTTNATTLYFEELGEGPPLLFLHGSGSTLEDSRLLYSLFSNRFTLGVHDYRGLGRSVPAPDRYEVGDLAGDALDLMDALEWEQAAVIGISFGGMVAQELAAKACHRVSRLALLCTSSGGHGGASYPLHTLGDLPAEERLIRLRRLTDTRFSDEWLAGHPSDRRLVELLEQRGTEPQVPDTGYRAQMDARSRHDVWERLGSITCPTLVAGGRFDGIAPPANLEALASAIPSADLALYEGGHAFFIQDPKALVDIADFLDPPGAD
jgi:pimeloyl-ACP methyl ester carboxylesterase